MKYLLPIFFGFLTGAVCGFTLLFLFPATFRTSYLKQALIGGGCGGVFGALIGSISGDLNASSDAGGNRILVAFVFGALGGFLGVNKLDILQVGLQSIGFSMPF